MSGQGRLPLVLADDGLIQQLQAGDEIVGLTGISAALAQVLIQNNAIIKMLAGLWLAADGPSISDAEVEEVARELS